MVLALAVCAATVTAPAPPASAAPVPLDAYGGDSATTLTATGFFHTQLVNGRWWLVTPDGHPFFSAGINHVTQYGTTDKNGNQAYYTSIVNKYGSVGAWSDAMVARFSTWGFNTLGGWSSNDLFTGRLPYTQLFSFGGQDFVTGGLSDFFDPAWVASVQSQANATAGALKDDPWLVGYFLDNELHWDKDWRFLDQLDLFLQRPATAPGKQHLVAWLQTRYGGDYAAFAADFSPSAADWATLAAPSTVTDTGPGAAATRAAWAGELADRFFSVTNAALKAADPNHLNLGARFLTQVTVPEVVTAAGKHVDVMSANWYDLKPDFEQTITNLGPAYVPTADTLRAWHDLTGKPLLISEFGYRAMDSGLPNTWPPFQVVLDTQQQRADRYRNYVDCLVNTGYVVGAHWFELTDEPAIGRFDGEDDNWGLVTEADDEYPLVIAAAQTLHDHMYAPLSDPGSLPFPCQPVGAQPAAAPGSTTTTAPATVPVVTPAFTG